MIFFAVGITVFYYAAMRLLRLALSVPLLLFRAAGLLPHIQRHPYLSLVIAMASTAAACAFPDHGTYGAPAWAAARAGIYLIGIAGVFYVAAVFRRVPGSLEEIYREAESAWPCGWFVSRLANPKDAWFVGIVFRNTCLTLPAFLTMLAARNLWGCGFYLIALLGAAMSHEPLDHTNIHNHIFRSRKGVSRRESSIIRLTGIYLDWILNPLCGRIPDWYKVQHLYVHHVENNGLNDDQSTLPYDRASFLDFCRAAFRFSFNLCFSVSLLRRLRAKRLSMPIRRLQAGMVAYFLALGAIALISWPIACFLLAVRFLSGVRSTQSFYIWHALAEPDDPENAYVNSLNNLGTDDHGGLGNGIHIEHHLNPRSHWTTLHGRAEAGRPGYSAHYSVELKDGGEDGGYFLAALWARRFDLLASRLVIHGSDCLSMEERERFIEARTRPINPLPKSVIGTFDAALGKLAGRALLQVKLPVREADPAPREERKNLKPIAREN